MTSNVGSQQHRGSPGTPTSWVTRLNGTIQTASRSWSNVIEQWSSSNVHRATVIEQRRSEMSTTSSGTHRFRCFTPVDPSRVWVALTDGRETCRYLHGLVAESSWCAEASIRFRTAPVHPESHSTLAGRVLCVQPQRRLSYFLRSGPEDPSTYLTWELRSCPGGSTVHLQVDRADCADSAEEAEDTWLPVLAALQTLLSRPEPPRS